MKFFLWLGIGCTVCSCKPKVSTYSLKGQLVNACSNSPINSVKVQARQTNVANGFSESALSDKDGNFEIAYSTSQKTTFHFLNLTNELPVETADYGRIPLYSNSTVYYRIKAVHPHTASDTLYILNLGAPNAYYKMYGPFHDTVIGLQTLTFVNTLAYNSSLRQIEQTNTTNAITASYKINHTNYALSNSVTRQVSSCNAVADTLVLIID